MLALLFVSLSPTYSYELSVNEETRVEEAADAINIFIERKGEQFRPVLLSKIDAILERNIWDENIAIFTLLWTLLAQDLVENKQITTRLEVAEPENLEETPIIEEEEIWEVETIQEVQEDEQSDSIQEVETIQEIEVLDSDFNFIYDHNAFECDANPCDTTKNAIKIVWEVDNPVVEYVEVNDYRLSSYQWSSWEYNPNVVYNNFADGENIYVINYLDENETVVYSEEFIINKQVPEIVAETTNSDTNTDEWVSTQTSAPSYSVNSDIPNVDEDEVRQYWIDLINGERNLIWLSPYTYDPSLDKTAKIWSDIAVSRWYIDHKVNSPSDSYYDYWKKVAWMENNGVVCENISRATFSESIAWNIYTCAAWTDCTDGLKSAVKKSFDFYMSEKWTDYHPHYRALAHPLFETMWLGLSVTSEWNNRYKMYLTNHYCTTNTL